MDDKSNGHLIWVELAGPVKVAQTLMESNTFTNIFGSIFKVKSFFSSQPPNAK